MEGSILGFTLTDKGAKTGEMQFFLLSSLPSPLQMGQKHQVSGKSGADLKPAANGF